jgi:disulfide bond formation protein DsbB
VKSYRLMPLFVGGSLGLLALILALATNEWWALPIALAVWAVSAFLSVKVTLSALDQETKPDPVAVARIEAEHGPDAAGLARADDAPGSPRA